MRNPLAGIALVLVFAVLWGASFAFLRATVVQITHDGKTETTVVLKVEKTFEVQEGDDVWIVRWGAVGAESDDEGCIAGLSAGPLPENERKTYISFKPLTDCSFTVVSSW